VTSPPDRPDADALRVRAAAGEATDDRTRFKVRFGFAPGVGKTHRVLPSRHDAAPAAREYLGAAAIVAIGPAMRAATARLTTAALTMAMTVAPTRARCIASSKAACVAAPIASPIGSPGRCPIASATRAWRPALAERL